MSRLPFAPIVLLIACGASQTPGSPSTTAPTRRVLYLTHSAGFMHAVLPLSQQIVTEIGTSARTFETTATTDVATLTASSLSRFDAVIFFTSGQLPIGADQQQALINFVRSGKGFVGIHSATDTFYDWPEYGELIGGYFDGHPWHQAVSIRVEDTQHPATAHLGSTLAITDEIYQFRNWSRDRVHVLLSLDLTSVNPRQPGVNRTDNDFALAWTRTAGAGRVFYTALGHDEAVWRDTRFQQHLLGGIRWVMGK
jgi:type 1 glutamine amidotransferase